MSVHRNLYQTSYELDSFVTTEQNQTVHTHLCAQFAGIIAKLQQELDGHLQTKHDDLEAHEQLYNRLKAACYTYQISETSRIIHSVEQFCADCNDALEQFKISARIYQINLDNDINTIQITHVLDLFMTQINAVVSYVDIPMHKEEYSEYNHKKKLLISLFSHFITTKKSPPFQG